MYKTEREKLRDRGQRCREGEWSLMGILGTEGYYLITSSAQRTCNTSSSGDGASEPGGFDSPEEEEYSNKDPFEDRFHSFLGLAARTSICPCPQVKIYRGSRAFTTKDQRTIITTVASICHKIKIHLGTKASTTAITINPASKEVSPSRRTSHMATSINLGQSHLPTSLRHSHQQPMHHHLHSSQTPCPGRQTKTMTLLPLSLHL
ncbi:uncharacterized protein [Pseudochaenichthys georgianus]|uniref:uncharacterized protein n=1 Tax=Pseudochaenichthys georgianus TaxID=52239 RepID=UPI0039C4818B